MSKGFNQAILVGNVGNDPEVREVGKESLVANLRLATSDGYTDANGDKVDTTQWHNLVFWNRLAEIVESYVKKGSRLQVVGKIVNRQYEDENGQTRYISEIKVSDMIMLDGASGNGKESDDNEQQHSGGNGRQSNAARSGARGSSRATSSERSNGRRSADEGGNDSPSGDASNRRRRRGDGNAAPFGS